MWYSETGKLSDQQQAVSPAPIWEIPVEITIDGDRVETGCRELGGDP